MVELLRVLLLLSIMSTSMLVPTAEEPSDRYHHLELDGQWEQPAGTIIAVDAGRALHLTDIPFTKVTPIRDVPLSAETPKNDAARTVVADTPKVGKAGRCATGSLLYRVGADLAQSPGIVSGLGQLCIFVLVGNHTHSDPRDNPLGKTSWIPSHRDHPDEKNAGNRLISGTLCIRLFHQPGRLLMAIYSIDEAIFSTADTYV